ncbi:MAG: hypothetical protein JWQ22_535 [Devosia sp.]|nr:hypothetical protein [Devosia sp.]
MTKHTITVEIGDQTYAQLLSIAQSNGVPLDDMLLEAIYRVIEDTQDMTAIAEYQKQKADGTLETTSFEEVKRRLGLDD